MFGSVKVKNWKLTVFSLICLALFVAVCLLALRAGAPDTVDINGESYSLRAEDEEDTRAFITACGYEAGGLISRRAVTVPMYWNDTYTEYSETQTAQGFDLVPYKGKEAEELTYAPDGDERITLLISGNKIIAAHICDTDGGDMRPLIP